MDTGEVLASFLSIHRPICHGDKQMEVCKEGGDLGSEEVLINAPCDIPNITLEGMERALEGHKLGNSAFPPQQLPDYAFIVWLRIEG
jgi:hypothetical protein